MRTKWALGSLVILAAAVLGAGCCKKGSSEADTKVAELTSQWTFGGASSTKKNYEIHQQIVAIGPDALPGLEKYYSANESDLQRMEAVNAMDGILEKTEDNNVVASTVVFVCNSAKDISHEKGYVHGATRMLLADVISHSGRTPPWSHLHGACVPYLETFAKDSGMKNEVESAKLLITRIKTRS